MNEGAPMMYHGGGGFGGPSVYVMGPMERQARQYTLEPLASSRSSGGSPGSAGTPRRWQPRRDRHNRDNTAFGYDSDDSSLSSNASSSNKSADKGESSGSSRAVGGAGAGAGGGAAGGGYGAREWRGRRRDQRPQRRIAPERFLNAAYPFQVKFTPDDLLNGSKYDTLSQEIWDKFVKSQQTEETFRKKMNLWRYLYITIKSIFPRYGLYVVGSTMSGFGLESSDMDLCLHVRAHAHHHVEPRTHALLHLNYILGYIRSFDPGAELIQAKVPILKFRDVRNGLQVDLNCNNVVGIRNTDLLHCFSRMDWRVRPLVALMKLWAQAHNINDARQRTLSSYSLTLMVIHFLQNGAVPAVLPRAHEPGAGAAAGGAGGAASAAPRPPLNKATLGELFLNMLQYYADFPFSKRSISIRAPRRVPRPAPRPAALICVEEPFDLSNTARSVYDPETFDKIVSTFRDSAARLAPALRLRDAWPAPHAPHTPAHAHTHPQR